MNTIHSMNIINLTEYKGKKLKKSETNLLNWIAEKFPVHIGEEKGKRQNPYSGVIVELDPFALFLHDFIINNYRAGFVGRIIPVSKWDTARYLFMSLWPDEYFKLID